MTKLKAVFKDDAVRCEKCGVEIWEDVDCDCGVDGADHEGLKEAYEEKAKTVWSSEDKAKFRELNRERMRLHRDKQRKRRYSPRKRQLKEAS